MPMIINGIGVSRGTAQGRVHMLKRSGGNIAKRELAPEQVEPELRAWARRSSRRGRS